jgi:hypothetical protein
MTTSPGTPEASPDRSPGDELSVGMVGHAFMGAAHSQAWRNAPRFFDLPLHPRMKAVAGRDATPWSSATTSTWSTSAPLATPTRRSPSRPSRPASTSCARSRSPTRSRRPRR